jgi:hypothetical protein
MHEILHSVRSNASALLLLGVGLVLLVRGLRRGIHALQRGSGDPLKALALVRGYRIAISGVCLSAYSLGWWWQSATLRTVALVIGLEEIAESSFYLAALKRAPTSWRADVAQTKLYKKIKTKGETSGNH